MNLRTVTRKQAIAILAQVTDQDNFWEVACETVRGWKELGDDDDINYPSLQDVFAALGVSPEELVEAEFGE